MVRSAPRARVSNHVARAVASSFETPCFAWLLRMRRAVCSGYPAATPAAFAFNNFFTAGAAATVPFSTNAS